MDKSEIQKFYTGQTIFITGGTGFIGKVVIEKLLRACFDLRRIYILVRTKKQKSEKERFKEIFDSECFESLKELHPNFLEKVSLIYGDCVKPDLGLSEENKEILMREVTTILHVAATVRFDQHLRSATYINMRSVKDLITMAKQMPQLRAFVHVSTAFSNCPREDIQEKFYEPPIKYNNLMKLLDSLDDETISAITPTLLKDWPNTYVFTKCIAESVVEEEGKDLPIAMVRPAIVIASVKEPKIGWVDNIYGICGIFIAVALGIVRVARIDTDVKAETVPLDFVMNNILVAAWNIENQRQKSGKQSEISIYNYVSSTLLYQTFETFLKSSGRHGRQVPPSKAIWYMIYTWKPNRIHYEIAVFFLHTLPAYLIDFILLCMGRKRIAVEGYKKVRKLLDVTAYFSTRSWTFDSKNVINLISVMSSQDKELFDFDLRKENWDKLIEKFLTGGRVYILKDPLDTIPEAKKKQLLLRIAHYVFCSFVLFVMYGIIRLMLGFIF